ncbi:hypothetical protein SUGI_0141540 [Cryptomeria japonica]|nr:hypothetical protein SUGI_0141540 [Cryptomeria japonica]
MSRVVKQILGDLSLRINHEYRVNIDILVVFLATWLYFGLSKRKSEILYKNIIKSDLLRGLDQALWNIDEELTILLPIDFRVTFKNRKKPPRFLILYIKDMRTFNYKRFIVEKNANFLWGLFKKTKIDREDWIANFLEFHGFSEFASKERLKDWAEELSDIWESCGEEPDQEVECFPESKQIDWGKCIPTILIGFVNAPSLTLGLPSSTG